MTSPRRPYAFPRGQISQRQERALQRHTHFLVGDLISKALVAELTRRFVLNRDDAEYILRAEEDSKDPQREQNQRLLETVCRRSSEGFEAFLEALRVTGHDKAYRKLRTALDGLPEDMQLALHGEEEEGDSLEPSIQSERMERLSKPKGVFYAGDLRRGKDDDDFRVLQRRRLDAYHLDRADDTLQLKKTIRQQKMELERLKGELNEACDEIQRLKKVTAQQEAELIEQKGLTNHKAELLEQADRKITRLLEEVKGLEDDKETLSRESRSRQHKLEALEGKVADLEVRVAHQQEHNDIRSNRISFVVKKLKSDAEELLRVSGPKKSSQPAPSQTATRQDTDTDSF